jgi:hypothetical protein
MRARITLAIGAVMLGSTACAKQERPPAQAAAPAPPAVVTVHAKDFAYTAPDTVPAGLVTFNLVNDGPDLHHATIVRLDSGKTAADLDAALKTPGPLPAWAVPLGGPNAPAPGDTSDATLNLAAGHYDMLCFVDVPGGVPHFAKGMSHPFVAAGTAPANQAAPAADLGITLQDYGFVFSKPLTSGHHVVSVTNAGPQPHEVEIVKLAPGKSGQDLIAWLAKPEGPPPGLPIGGTSFQVPATTTYFSVDLTPGTYLFICFVPDAKDGKPHFAHGMMHTETIS